MERKSERSGPSEAPSKLGEANGAEALKPGAQDESAPEEPQPAYDWQAAFQAFYGQGQRQASGPIPSGSLPPYPWAGQNVPAAMFSGGLPGPMHPGGYTPYSSSPGSGFDPSVSRVKAWLPSQLSGQLSGGGSLTRDGGSLGSLGNLLKSNGDSMSRSSGGSESSQEDDKAKVDTDLAPGLHILRKRSYEHMGLDAVAAAGTGMPPYRGRGAFASASGLDFSSAPGKPIPSVKGLALHPARQPMDSGGADDVWLQMGQGTDSGGGEGKGDPDDKEVRKQRRKQSNRESARRSRLRKQAECEELSGRVDHLSKENLALRAELIRLSDQCGQLASDNRNLQEELLRVRSRGHSWRPLEASSAAPLRPAPAPSHGAGASQARKDRPPLGAPPFFSPEKRSPEKLLQKHTAAADHSLGNGDRQRSLRLEGHFQPPGDGGPAVPNGWPDLRRPWVPQGPAAGALEDAPPPSTGKAVPEYAARGAPPVFRTASQVEAAVPHALPTLKVAQENGAAVETGRDAQNVGDAGPSTPGPTLTSKASSPPKDSRLSGPAWLRESKGDAVHGQTEEASFLDELRSDSTEYVKVKGMEGERLSAMWPVQEMRQAGAASGPPVLL